MTHDSRRVHSSSTVPPVVYRDALHCASRAGHNGYVQMKVSFLEAHSGRPYASALRDLYGDFERMAREADIAASEFILSGYVEGVRTPPSSRRRSSASRSLAGSSKA